MDQQSRLARARRHVEAVTGFYVHFAIYILVNALLVMINILNDPVWWVQWPILGWGVGIAFHAALVFFKVPHAVARWQLRRIHAIKDRI